MATKWEEVISDKNTYPDDTVLKLADGTEVPLRELRPGYMKDADYRQKTSLLARQREEFEAQAVQRMQALQEGEAQLRAIATELMKQNPGMTRSEAEAEVSGDSDVRKLKAEIAELRSVVTPLADYVKDFDTRSKQARQQYVVNEHRKALQDLKAKHPDLNEAELVTYAKDHLVPNLYEAHKLMTYDQTIEARSKAAREEAYKEAYEKGKQEALAAPILPMRTITMQPTEGAPKNMKEAVSKALLDPEVMGPLMTGRIG